MLKQTRSYYSRSTDAQPSEGDLLLVSLERSCRFAVKVRLFSAPLPAAKATYEAADIASLTFALTCYASAPVLVHRWVNFYLHIMTRRESFEGEHFCSGTMDVPADMMPMA